jgi:hypothetical protein
MMGREKEELVAQMEKVLETLKRGTDEEVARELDEFERLLEQWRRAEGLA